MKIFNDGNSLMMLGLVNTLCNNGTLTKKDRDDIIDLGYFMDEMDTRKKAKELVASIKEMLNKE
jgi:hypothetical protein